MEVVAVEYYANETEDDIENGIVGGLVEEIKNPNSEEVEDAIIGETFIKPKTTHRYYFNGSLLAEWQLEGKNLPIKTKKIDDYTKFMEENHIKRLGEGVCTAYVGAQYLSLSSNAERVADHLLNVGKSIKTYAFIEAK